MATVALAGCGGGAGFLTAPSSVSLSLQVADHPELAAVGGVAYVSADGSPLAIVRTGAAAFAALSRICPHQGGQINAVTGGFQCIVHGARFGSTGTWQGGQPTSSMRSYPTAYDSDTDTLTIG